MKEPQSMQELVDLAVARHQTSVRQMSILAKNNGHQVTYTTLNQILSGTYKSAPKAVTLRAIAWLAGVSDETAFKAAGQPVPGPPFAEELPPGVDNLPAKARKAAIDMLRVLVDMNKEAADHATHMSQTGPSPAMDVTFNSRDAIVNIRSKDDNGAQGKKVPYVDPHAHPDADESGHIPLPDNYYELAASGHRNLGAEEDARARARGEETQDTDQGTE